MEKSKLDHSPLYLELEVRLLTCHVSVESASVYRARQASQGFSRL